MANDRVTAPVVTTVLTFALAAFGLIILLVTAIGAAALLLSKGSPPAGLSFLFALLSILFVGATLAIFCFLLALLLRIVADHQRTAEAHHEALKQMQVTTQFLEQSLRDAPASTATLLPPVRAAVPPAPQHHGHSHAVEEKALEISRTHILEILQRLHDTALMNDTQRQQLATRHWQKRKAHLTTVIERDVLTGEFGAAQAHVDELVLLLPSDPEVELLRDRVNTEYTMRLSEDLAAARAQLRQLLSITAWQEAQELVVSLQRKYPQKEEIDHLMREVIKERDKHDRETKERLLTDIADASERRQWRRAAGAAEDFIARFPTEPVSERLRIDVPTLQENAAAQDRKEQEQLFKDLLKQHRYEEAIATARQVIDKHPASTAAAELTKLLPRVEELQRQEKVRKDQPAPQPA